MAWFNVQSTTFHNRTRMFFWSTMIVYILFILKFTGIIFLFPEKNERLIFTFLICGLFLLATQLCFVRNNNGVKYNEKRGRWQSFDALIGFLCFVLGGVLLGNADWLQKTAQTFFFKL